MWDSVLPHPVLYSTFSASKTLHEISNDARFDEPQLPSTGLPVRSPTKIYEDGMADFSWTECNIGFVLTYSELETTVIRVYNFIHVR